MAKTWKFKKSGDFYTDLAMRESSNTSSIVNKYGYMGLYQIGKLALIDIGYIDNKTKKWTGKNGINSQQNFLDNPKVQNIAVREYHKIIWEQHLKNYHQYDGKTIGNIQITKSGMIAAAHLVGHTEVKKFINSKGKIIAQDGNNVTCTEYLKELQNYEVDYSITRLVQELELMKTPKLEGQPLLPNNDYYVCAWSKVKDINFLICAKKKQFSIL